MSIHVDSNDIWLKINSFDTGDEFIARLGCGGAIGNLVYNTQELLSPSFRDEKTDRIIQWTLWSNSITNTVTNLPKFEWRYNVTQGGDFNGNFSDTRRVTIDNVQKKIEVFSTPTLNWKQEQQHYFHGGLNSLTIYQITDTPGKIQITRILKPYNVTIGNDDTKRDVEFKDTYLEAWTPLSNKVFNSIALSFNSTNPNGGTI